MFKTKIEWIALHWHSSGAFQIKHFSFDCHCNNKKCSPALSGIFLIVQENYHKNIAFQKAGGNK